MQEVQAERGTSGLPERQLFSGFTHPVWLDKGFESSADKEGGVESEVLERYRRRQRQVDRVLLEAFLLGHSTRKTARMFKSLFGGSVSAQAVSNIVKGLDQQVKQFPGVFWEILIGFYIWTGYG